MDIACPTCAATYEIDDGSVGDTGRKVRCAGCGTVWRAFRDQPSLIISAPPPSATPEVAIVADPPPLAPAEADIAPGADLPRNDAAFAGEQPEIAPASTPAEAVLAGGSEPNAVAEAEAGPPRKARIVKGKPAKKASGGASLKRLLAWPTLVVAATLGLAAAGYAFREPIVRLAPQSAALYAALGLPVNLRGIDIRNIRSRMIDDGGVNVLVIEGELVSVAKERQVVPRLRFAVIGEKGQEIFTWSTQADKAQLQPGEAMPFRRRLAAPPVDGKDVNVRFLSASDITAGLK
jgi:predicted Zn finger-like uncharacterized protein